jgi:hypothetical protein
VSHIVTIQTKLHDPAAVAAACKRLGLDPPTEGVAQLFAGSAAGLLVRLPGWRYPLVIDVLTGKVQYDIYGGAWGAPAHLDRLLQAYAVEKVRSAARAKGYAISEQQLQDGSIRLQIQEGS